MSWAAVLNRPGPVGRAWRIAYEAGYGVLRGIVQMLFRPLFGVRRVGPEPRWPEGGFVLCANHTSYLDPAFLQLAVRRRVTFLMTNNFYERPGGRWFFRLVGAVPMASGRMAHAGLRRAAALLRRGHVVVLFPEGRLSRDGTPGPPQRGIAALARVTGVPVFPVGVRGAFAAWPRGSRRPHRADVRLLFGSPMRWRGTTDSPLRDQEQAFASVLMDRIRVLAGFSPAEPAPHTPPPGR